MNKKHQRYIDYIANDIKPPYFKNMVEMYGATESEFVPIMTKVFNQYVEWEDNAKYENSDGWSYHTMNTLKDKSGKEIYYENIDGTWLKWGYDADGVRNYFENSDGYIEDER